VCIAKTTASLSADPSIKGAPTTVGDCRSVRSVRRSGARVHLSHLRRHAHHARTLVRAGG
jgi:formyltetrahydrofolate synthetase